MMMFIHATKKCNWKLALLHLRLRETRVRERTLGVIVTSSFNSCTVCFGVVGIVGSWRILAGFCVVCAVGSLALMSLGLSLSLCMSLVLFGLQA
jgi:hypothetical protein